MSLIFGDNDRAVLAGQIRRGEVVLILGAGASHGCLNAAKKLVKNGSELAKYLCSILNLEYHNEQLSEVCSAYIRNLGDDNLHRVLKQEYTNTKASDALKSLFRYTWKRVYSWNIDDSYLDAIRGSVQGVKVYNGMQQKVSQDVRIGDLDFVALHGLASEPENGYIFSHQEYTSEISEKRHPWYGQLIEDYRSFCPVFIGTSFNEPILDAELGSGLVDQSQKMTVAARAMAERKTVGHRS